MPWLIPVLDCSRASFLESLLRTSRFLGELTAWVNVHAVGVLHNPVDWTEGLNGQELTTVQLILDVLPPLLKSQLAGGTFFKCQAQRLFLSLAV